MRPTAYSLGHTRGEATQLGPTPERLEDLAELNRLPVAELSEQYEALFGKPPRSRNGGFLQRRVAWKIQERVFGGLAPAASRRLAEPIEQLNPLAEAAARARVLLDATRPQRRVEKGAAPLSRQSAAPVLAPFH